MPGPIVHLQNIQKVPGYLRELGGARGIELADLLDKQPCSPYANFGAQGPDFLVFSLKEYGTPLDEFANFLFGVFDALKPFIDFYESVVEPVEDAIDDAVTAVDQALFQGLLTQVGDTSALITSALQTQLAAIVTKNVDLFYGFYPKLQQGKPEDKWYWFDTWHYRRTGTFASTMWKLAQGDDDLMRYAVGYGSHIGADVAGHPFVNSIVGGPYRSHWHRHHLVENWIDAYARKGYPDSRRTKRCLNLTSKDTYVADAISGSYYSRLCEFPGGMLPSKLADMLVKAVDLTYDAAPGRPVPPKLTATDYDTTYRLWLMWFERATSIGNAKKPTPVPPPGSSTAALFTDYVSGFPSPPSAGGGGGGFSVLDIFAAVLAFLKWVADSIAYTVDWTLNHIADIFLLPVTEALGLVKWLLYQIQKGVWQIYDEGRFALVLGGYLSPEPGDFSRTPWGTAFINTASAHLTGGPSPSAHSSYPLKQESHGMFGPMEHHLVYPGTPPELPASEPAPEPFFGANPDVVLTGFHPYGSQIEDLYTAKDPYGPGSAFTDTTDQATVSGFQFGSIPAFTARLLSGHIDDLPNFNLDADRGYGWKAWEPKQPDIDVVNPVDTSYIP
ncbi:zinc dependent phospholipase C family protein [Cellulomonas sp. P5_C6]